MPKINGDGGHHRVADTPMAFGSASKKGVRARNEQATLAPAVRSDDGFRVAGIELNAEKTAMVMLVQSWRRDAPDREGILDRWIEGYAMSCDMDHLARHRGHGRASFTASHPNCVW